MTALSRLADLHRRFDGPAPQHELDAALGRNTALMEAEGNAAFYRRMARRQLATIRERRADGSFYPALVDDLRLYLARYRHWRREARRLGAAELPLARAAE